MFKGKQFIFLYSQIQDMICLRFAEKVAIEQITQEKLIAFQTFFDNCHLQAVFNFFCSLVTLDTKTYNFYSYYELIFRNLKRLKISTSFET